MIKTRRADNTSIPRSERDYITFCASCHSLNRADNPTSRFPSLIDIGSRKPRKQLSLITQQSAERIPAFDQLSDAQRNAILDYMLSVAPPSTSRRKEGNATPTSM